MISSKMQAFLRNTAFIGLLLSIPLFGLSQGNDTLVTSLRQALDIGLSQSAKVRMAQIEIGKVKAMNGASFNPEKTDLNFQIGQYNSAESDFSFSVRQKVEFPKVYALQGKLHERELQRSEKHLDVAKHESSTEIKKAWQTLVYLAEKEKLLVFKDSLLTAVSTNMKIDPKDSLGLDRMMLDGYLEELTNDLQLLQADIDIAKRYLQVILNSEQALTFDLPSLVKRNMDVSGMTGSLVVNPLVAEAHEAIGKSITEVDLEKARMMPDLNFGYFNRSMIGETTVDGGVASRSNRFSGITLGVSVPLFYSSYKANISAAKIERAVVEAEVTHFQNINIAHIDQKASEMSKYDQSLEYFETKALPRADKLLIVSNKAFEQRTIHLNSYLRNLERALEIKMSYLATLEKYNQTVIELEYTLGIY